MIYVYRPAEKDFIGLGGDDVKYEVTSGNPVRLYLVTLFVLLYRQNESSLTQVPTR